MRQSRPGARWEASIPFATHIVLNGTGLQTAAMRPATTGRSTDMRSPRPDRQILTHCRHFRTSRIAWLREVVVCLPRCPLL